MAVRASHFVVPEVLQGLRKRLGSGWKIGVAVHDGSQNQFWGFEGVVEGVVEEGVKKEGRRLCILYVREHDQVDSARGDGGDWRICILRLRAINGGDHRANSKEDWKKRLRLEGGSHLEVYKVLQERRPAILRPKYKQHLLRLRRCTIVRDKQASSLEFPRNKPSAANRTVVVVHLSCISEQRKEPRPDHSPSLLLNARGGYTATCCPRRCAADSKHE